MHVAKGWWFTHVGMVVFYTTKGYRQQTQITLKRRTKACKCVSLDQIYTTAQALPHGSIYHPSLKLLQRTKQACIPVQHWVTGSILIPLCQGSTPRPPAVRVLSRGCSPSCAQLPNWEQLAQHADPAGDTNNCRRWVSEQKLTGLCGEGRSWTPLRDNKD